MLSKFIIVLAAVVGGSFADSQYLREKYIESKFKLTANQTSKDILIYNQDDQLLALYLYL